MLFNSFIKYRMSLEASQSQIDLNFGKEAKKYNFINTLKELENLDWKPSGRNWWKKNDKPNNNGINKLTEQQIWQIWNTMDNFTIQNREESYLTNHEKLSKAEYNALFSGKEKLQQKQFWDCYLVSSIIQLAGVQHFDTLVRTSFQRVQRKKWPYSWKKWYMVQIPFWEPSGRKIYIQDDELKIAKINWNVWYKLIELAYAKNKRPNNKRWNKYSPITEEEFSKIQWWWMKEAFETFLWKQNINFNTFWDKTRKHSLSNTSSNEKKQIIWFLKNYEPEIWNKFISLSSIWWKSDTKRYDVWWKRVYHGHAYALTWINKNNKWEIKSIRILNPWNTDEKPWWNFQDFTLNEFFQSFSFVSCWKIKTKEFLNEKSLT